MTDDFRTSLYQQSRPYHFFKVVFTVYNKVTDQCLSRSYFVSSKNTLKWLSGLCNTRGYLPLPTTYFTYTYTIFEVEDSPSIVFHHIPNREAWEWFTVETFLEVCAL